MTNTTTAGMSHEGNEPFCTHSPYFPMSCSTNRKLHKMLRMAITLEVLLLHAINNEQSFILESLDPVPVSMIIQKRGGLGEECRGNLH